MEYFLWSWLYFPTKSVTWRKGSGAFKLDTTVKINEENIIKGHTFRIDDNIDLNELKTFILLNFDEEFYKSGAKCDPYFPTKSVTWRKGSGAFKLDTTVKINEENIIKGHTFRIDDNIDLNELKTFILLNIE